MGTSFAYINDSYGLRLKRGMRVVYTGGKKPRPGTVVSATGAHINVRFDDAPKRVAGPFHPTWEMEYPSSPTETQP